jgi:hypothetical protein
MKKDKKDESVINDVKTSDTSKSELPIKTPMTNTIKNTASQTPGLNQAKTTRDDLLPSDGDNLTK